MRQTVSKWEQGLSVPDADMLLMLSEVFETPVSTLLGETVMETPADPLRAISEKLEVINLQLAKRKNAKEKIYQRLCHKIKEEFYSSSINLHYDGRIFSSF